MVNGVKHMLIEEDLTWVVNTVQYTDGVLENGMHT